LPDEVNSTYLVQNNDVGANISVSASYTDAHGTTEGPLVSSPVSITNINDEPIGLPVISGSLEENQILSADTNAIADDDGLGTFIYRWMKEGIALPGETASKDS